jgi:hypothetical protein
MPTVAEYQAKAAEFREMAQRETNPALRAHMESMVIGYLKLAEVAARNSETDLVYETPPAKPQPAAPGMQQQQQIQPKTSDET